MYEEESRMKAIDLLILIPCVAYMCFVFYKNRSARKKCAEDINFCGNHCSSCAKHCDSKTASNEKKMHL